MSKISKILKGLLLVSVLGISACGGATPESSEHTHEHSSSEHSHDHSSEHSHDHSSEHSHEHSSEHSHEHSETPSSSSEEHVHTFRHYYAVAPTCDDPGCIEYQICTTCGNIYNMQEELISASELVIPKLGHLYGEWNIVRTPTCTSAGLEQRVCSRNPAHVESRDIDPTNHSWGNWQVVNEPTCTSTGLKRRVCLNDPTHIEEEAVPVNPDAHDFGEWVYDELPTCTTKGRMKRVCKYNEQHVEFKDVDPLNHNYEFSLFRWDSTNPEDIKAYAVLVCSNDNTHTKEEAASVESYLHAEATCDQPERIGLRATYGSHSEDKLFDGDPKLNHEYKFSKFIWSADGKTAQVYLVCENDNSHTDIVDAAISSKIKTARSCFVDEITTFTASYQDQKEDNDVKTNDAYGEHVPATPVRENEVAPSCSKVGSYDEVVYCSRCGAEISRTIKEIEKTEHTPGTLHNENVVAPTCEDSGSHDEVIRCTVCDEIISSNHVVDEATGHKAGEAQNENVVAPTCTESGSHDEVVYCTVCHKVLSSKHVIDEATGHSYGDWVIDKNASCIEDGAKHRVCSKDSEHIENEIIPATGHTPAVAVKENEVPATYEADGSYEEVIYCSTCNSELSRTPKVIPMLTHHYGEWKVVTAATCNATGLERRECTDEGCEAFEERTTAKLKHDYVVNTVPATCSAQGYDHHECKLCHDTYDDNYQAKLAHNWNYAEQSCEHGRECLTCGEKEAALEHEYELTEELVLGKTCLYNRVNVCKNCGDRQVVDQIYKHSYVNVVGLAATCKEEGYYFHKCSLCGEFEMDGENKATTVIPVDTVNGHNWVLGASVDPVTHIREDECSICHEVRQIVVYENNSTDSTKGSDLGLIELKDATVDVSNETAQDLGDKDVTLSVDTKTTDDFSGMSQDDKDKIGDNTIYDFNLTDNATSQNISEFNGVITITIPYELGIDEDPDSIVIYYINDNDELEEITNVIYSNGYVTFEVEHFSSYVVGNLTPAEICAKKGHKYQEVAVTGDCTHASYIKLICSRCGDETIKDGSYHEATGHTFVKLEEVAATCINDGYKIEKCSVCGYQKTTIYAATGHNYISKEVVAPKCEEDGYTIYECEHCHATYIADYVDMLGHEMSDWEETVAPTCSSYGKEARHCTHEGCDLVETRNVAMKEHNPGETQIVKGKEATCSNSGYHLEVVRCKDCNILISSIRVEDPKLDHDYGDWIIVKEATCSSSGLRRRVCKNDPTHILEEVIPMTGHVKGEAVKENEVVATCTSAGSYDLVERCSVCNKILSSQHYVIPALGHDYGEWIIDVAPTCNVAGSRHRVCKNDPTHIEYEDLPMSNKHQYEEYKENEVAPTCTKAGGYDLIIRCKVCGKVYSSEHINVPATGHVWGEWLINEPTCTLPGYRERFCENDPSHVEFEEIAPRGHVKGEEIKENIVEATCTTAGHYDLVTYCSVCKRELERRTVSIDALGHDYGDWKVIDEGSCTVDHVEQRICAHDATHVETRIVKASGHTEAQPVRENIIEPTCTKGGSYDEVIYCSACGTELSRNHVVVDKLDHQEATRRENYVDATCASAGSYDLVTYCLVCDEEISRETIILEKLPHTAGKAVIENKVEATCSKAGSYDEVIYCDICHQELSRTTKVIPVIDHVAAPAVRENVIEPTCDKAGSYDLVTYCSVCNKELSRDTIVIPATEHVYGEEVKENEVAPTCASDGGYDLVIYCEECGEELSRRHITIDALGHTPSKEIEENRIEATCTKEGSYDMVVYCEICHEELSRRTVATPKAAHTPGEVVKENEVAPTCTEAGSYDEVIYCSTCGQLISKQKAEVAPLGHDYGEWVVVKAATCKEEGLMMRVCSRDDSHVDYETIEKVSHVAMENYGYDSFYHFHVCEVCGEHFDIENHKFDEDGYCVICGYQQEGPQECDHEHLPILTLNISNLGYCEGSEDWEYVYCPVCDTNYALNATSMAQPACKFDYSSPTTVKLTYKGKEIEFMKITCSVCGKSIYAQEKDESTDGCVHIGHLWMAVENPDGSLMVLEGSTTYESHEYKQYELKVGCEGSYINYYGCPRCGKLLGIEQVVLKGCETTEEYITNEDGSVIAIITCSKCGLHVEATSKNTYISQCEYDQYIYYHVYDKENEYLEFSNSQRISDHKVEQTVEFVNGKDCEDGYKVSSVCSVCGQSLGGYSSKGHNYFSERFDLNEYGVEGYYIADKCQICGAENLRERRVFFETESETNDYKTEDGKAVLEYHEYNKSKGYSFFMRTIAEEDGCYRTVDFHFEIDIKDKFHREFDFVEKEAHHDVVEALTTYELLHDYCYQGVRVTRHCIDCGEDFIDTVYNHPKTTKNYISLKDEYGCCDGYIENEVCQICGEQVGNARLELEPDSHKLSVETSSYTDDMGYKHVSEIQVCKVCGLEYHIDSVKRPYKDQYTYEVEAHEYLVIRGETVYESSYSYYEGGEPQPEQVIRVGLDYQIANAVMNNLNDFYDEYPQYSNYRFEFNDYDVYSYDNYDYENFDVISLASEGYYTLAKQGVLLPLNDENYEYAYSSLKEYSVNEALINGTLYGLPYSLSNGYFMYYDKYVISEDILNNLTAIIEQCRATGKTFAFEYNNAWYASSVYHGAGVYSDWEYYGNGIFTGYEDNFYSEEGAIAANVLYQLMQDSNVVISASSAHFFYEGAAAVITGIWEYQSAMDILGEERLGIAVLPCFQYDGENYQMKPFMYHNYFAAINNNMNDERAEVINAFIKFISSDRLQERYFEENSSMILTNINADKYHRDNYTEPMKVLDAQAALGYHVQGRYPNEWWEITTNILRNMQNGYSAEEALAIYNDRISELVSIPHEHEYVRTELHYNNGKDCYEGGYEVFTCSICGAFETRTFYGHDCSIVDLSRYTKDGDAAIVARGFICDRCGEFDYLEVDYCNKQYIIEDSKTIEYDGITFEGYLFSYEGTTYYEGVYADVISSCAVESHTLRMFEDGERQYVRHETNYIDNHDYQLIERHFNKDNDCESGGYEIYKCSKCEHVRQEDFYGHNIYGQDRSVYLEDKTPLIYAYVYECERCGYVENIEVKIENEKLFNFSEEDITYNGITYHCKKYTYINGDIYLAYGSYQEEISECKTLNRELTIYFDGENTYAVERNFDYNHHGAYSYRYSGNCEKELYVEIYCERCGEFLKSYYTNQPHQYNEDGYCVICGHYNGGGSGEAYTYTREDVDYLYDQNLGLYEYLINYAKGITDDNLRYVIYAQAEAELLNSGLITPTNSQGGYYAVSRVAPHTIPNAICGSDADRLKGVVVVNSDEDHPFISASDREALIELWNNARVSGEEYDPISYLLEQGYTLDDTYRTSFSYLRTFDILNTAYANDTEVLVNFVDGLLEYDNFGNLNPQLATSYEVSEDGLTYTFHLREDAYWYTYDGEQYAQVTADDFVAGFQHMLDAKGGLEYLVADLIVGCYDYLNKGNKDFNNIGVKAIDDFTLVVTLVRPTSYFVTELTYSCFSPMNRAYFTSKGGKFGNEYEPNWELYTYGIDYQNILYNGAYLPEYVDLYDAIILEANENYYDANNVNLDRIEFYYTNGSEDNVTYWNQLKSNHYSGGTLNFANGVAQLAMNDGLFDDYAYVTPLNGVTFFAGVNVNRGNWSAGSVESPQSYFDAVNTHQALNNANFRRALQHAFDRVSYNAIATGEEIGAYSVRNMLTHPEFVSLSEDVTLDDGSFFAKGTMYYEIVEYYLANKYGREVNLEDGQDGWYNPELAYQYLDMAKAELGDKWQQVQIDYIIYNNKSQIAKAEFYKQNIESILGPDNVCVNIIICHNTNDYYQYGAIYASPETACYDIGVGTGWGPDYIDPSTYLDTFDRRGYMSGNIGLDGEMNSYTFGGGSQQPHYHNYQLKDIYYHNGKDCSEGGQYYYFCQECGDSYWETFSGHSFSLYQEEIYDNEGHVVAIVNNEKCDRCDYLYMSLAAYDDEYATKTDAELEYDGIVYQGYKITINGLDMYYFSGEYTEEVSECESNVYMINYFYRDGEFMAFPTTKNYQNHGEIITTSEGNCDKGRHVTKTCAVCGKVVAQYITYEHEFNDENICIYCGKYNETGTYIYERDDNDSLYNNILGDFEYYANQASQTSDLNLRYVEYALAEASLMDSGVMVPTYSRGGTYAMTRVAPHTVSNAMWGNDSDRLRNLVVVEKDDEHLFITAEDREALIALWAAARNGGEEYDPIAYLESKGYRVSNTYTTTYSSEPNTLDILDTSKARDTEFIVNAIEGLLEYDNLGTLQPRLAKALPTLSADGKTYTFEIRDDAYWYTADGQQYAKVTADDFVAGFQHMLDCHAGLEWLCIGVIKGVSEYVKGEVDFSEVGYRVNEQGNLEIELVEPESFFLTRLTYSCFMPMNRAFYESKGGKFGEDFDKTAEDYQYGLVSDLSSMVYNSAFIPTSVVYHSLIQYDKNNEYYDADKVTLNFIKWVYDIGENPDATYASAINGIYAGIGLSLSNGLLKKAQDDGYFDVFHYVTDTDSTTFFCSFNVNRGNWDCGTIISNQGYYDAVNTHQAMNNSNFRRALQHAWDRVTWNSVATGDDLASASLRNILTPPEFLALDDDVEFEGHLFTKGTTYGELVEYFLTNYYERTVDTEDGQDGWYNPELAQYYLDLALSEMGDISLPIKLDIVCYEPSRNQVAYANAFKQSIENALGAENVEIDILYTSNLDDYYLAGYDAADGSRGCYDAFYGSGWGPDYGDPSTYLDIFARYGYMVKTIGLDGSQNEYVFGGSGEQPHYHNYQYGGINYFNGKDCSEGGQYYYYCPECGDSYWNTFYGHELSLYQQEIYDNEGHVAAIVNHENCSRCRYSKMSLASYDDEYATKTDAELEYDGIVYQGYKITINGLDMYYFSGEYTEEVSECESNVYMINYFYRDGEFMAFPTTKNYQNHGAFVTSSEGTCKEGRRVTQKCAICGKVISEYVTYEHVINEEGVCIYCGEESLGTITIWCDGLVGDSTITLVEQFRKLAGSQYSFDYQIEYHGEGSTASDMIADPEAGADIYFFAQDQLDRLVRAGALSELSEDAASYVTTYNDSGSSLAATYDGAYYAFPATSDNGYFMYYDASFFKDVDMTDLDAIYAACKEGGRTIYFDYVNAWFNSAFFMGYGAYCLYEVDNDGYFVDVDDTYDSEAGYEAARAMARYFTDKFVFVSGSSVDGFEKGAAVVISGTWDYSAALSILGDNLGIAKLPRVRSRDGGELVQLSSFAGYKLVGTKPQKNATRAALVEALAAYLTSEEAQRMRFEQNGWGPSNANLQHDPIVMNSPALNALFAQNAYAKPQPQFPGVWWSIAGNIGRDIANGIDPVTAINSYKESLPGSLN